MTEKTMDAIRNRDALIAEYQKKNAERCSEIGILRKYVSELRLEVDLRGNRIRKLEEFVTIVGNGNWDSEFLLKRARELMGKEPKP